jgi:hypothetical protein
MPTGFIRATRSVRFPRSSILPQGSLLVLAGRVQPRLRIAALRTAASSSSSASTSSLSNREARLLLSSAGADLVDDDVGEPRYADKVGRRVVPRRAVAPRKRRHAGHETEIVPFAGDDRYLADYFRAEYLSRLSPEHLRS